MPCHWKSLLVCLSKIYPWWIHADYSSGTSLTCLGLTTRMSYSITFPGTEMRMTGWWFPWSSSFPFLMMEWHWPSFTPRTPLPFSMFTQGWWRQQNNNICQLPRHLRLHLIRAHGFMGVASVPSVTNLTLYNQAAKSYFLWPSSLTSKVTDSWGPSVGMKTEEKKAFSNSTFPVSSGTRTPIDSPSARHYTYLAFPADIHEEAPLVVLMSFARLSSKCTLAFVVLPLHTVTMLLFFLPVGFSSFPPQEILHHEGGETMSQVTQSTRSSPIPQQGPLSTKGLSAHKASNHLWYLSSAQEGT